MENFFNLDNFWIKVLLVLIPVVLEEVSKHLKLKNEKMYSLALKLIKASYIATELAQTGETGREKFNNLKADLGDFFYANKAVPKKVKNLLNDSDKLESMLQIIKTEADKELSYPGIYDIVKDTSRGSVEGYLEGVLNEVVGVEARTGLRATFKF